MLPNTCAFGSFISIGAVHFCSTSYCSKSMLLTLLAFAQPLAVHAVSKCCVAIDFPGAYTAPITCVIALLPNAFGVCSLVMLLLDQIKPIEQLVPVS